ncbi:MAG: threonine synthase [Chloroflexi bacterium]|jgi:threonine synthase|nr:MAG: threonine synthase [Chloroflexota bacterium]
MTYATSLVCRECGNETPLDPVNACDFCFGPMEVTYDYDAMRGVVTRESISAGPRSIWRYEALLPVDPEHRIDLQVGFTPLLRADNLARELGMRELWIKNDTMNPTWSFKDRVVAVASSRARQFGFETLACASTGNLANSVAAHAARGGMRAVVFIPHDLEAGKVLGSAIYDPTIISVNGSYDDVNRLCSELADARHWAFVNINVRPYYAEGSRTLGYEVAEQLGWRKPDQCIVPMASGALFTKIYKGMSELADLGLIDDSPVRMYGAQAQGCSPIATAWQAGTTNIRPVKPSTIAKSLAIGNPADGYYALKVMEESGGGAVAVSDPEIVASMKLLAETEGVFAETAGGVTLASLRKGLADGLIDREASTVIFITGGGLKTTDAIANEITKPIEIEGSLQSFEEAFAAAGG